MIENNRIKRKNFMLAISSPSGAGKTTISRALLVANNDLELSVSVTTRVRRESEQAGRDYHYKDSEEFNKLIEEDAFLEYAKVFDNYYGTLKSNVDKIFAKGRDVLFDIDWQGMETIASKDRDNFVSIFILPPSMSELERRLRARATDSNDIIKARMAKAHLEIDNCYKYDYIVVNYDISDSLKQINSILYAERLKKTRQLNLDSFINTLLKK